MDSGWLAMDMTRGEREQTTLLPLRYYTWFISFSFLVILSLRLSRLAFGSRVGGEVRLCLIGLSCIADKFFFPSPPRSILSCRLAEGTNMTTGWAHFSVNGRDARTPPHA